MKLSARKRLKITYNADAHGKQVITECRSGSNKSVSKYTAKDERGTKVFIAKKGYLASLAELFTMLDKPYKLG